MGKKIIGILLDSEKLTLNRVLLESDENKSYLSEMQKMLKCMTVDYVGVTGDIDAWVDDEGLFNQKRVVRLGRYYFPGNVLFLGHDNEGYSTDICLDKLKDFIKKESQKS